MNAGLTTAPFSLRPVRDEDGESLFRIYASTRAEELAPVPWPDQVKEAFLRDQFRLQTLDWARVNPRGDFAIIEIDGQAAGRFYVDRRADEIRVVDIALLPPFRGRGVGSALLRRAQEEAIRLRLPIRMHVERNNPARALYGRLGFRVIEDRGVYLFIEWRPETLETRPDAS